MTNKNFLTLKGAAFALTASLSLVLTGCVDEDFGYAAEDIKYAKAYESFFGKMPADKNWDLSSSTNHYDPDKVRAAQTRANSAISDGNLSAGASTDPNAEYEVKNTWFEVPGHTLAWMKKALVEGKDNRYLGSNFVLQLPENDFAIVPIFQGKSSITSALEVKVNGYPIQEVWKRSADIQVIDSKLVRSKVDGNWQSIGYYDGYSTYADANQMKAERNKYPQYPSYTDDAEKVRAKPIYFRSKDRIAISDNGFMYLSLHNIDKAYSWWTDFTKKWDENNEWTTIGHRLTSINPDGHMLALNVPWDARPLPSELPNICEYNDPKTGEKQLPSEVIMIACEDADGVGTDHDVNDVVFLLIGYPNAPTIVPTKEVIKKRYMCEDLGGTYDYDFNDIVVDVTQTQEYEIEADPNTIGDPSESVAGNITILNMKKKGCPVQTAKIARLCGTIPIQVRIGDYMFPKIKDPSGLNQAYADDGKYSTRWDLCNINPRTLCDGHHKTGCGCASHDDYSGNGGHEVTANRPSTRAANGKTDGWNPNEEHVIPCHTWDPDKNNIVIYADWGYYKEMYRAGDVTSEKDVHKSNPFPDNTQDFADFANGKKFPVLFPKRGDYPYIIATDQDVPWMNEGIHIPEAWISGDLSVRNAQDNDLIGNSFYMEKYPQGDAEGYIWSGDVNGIAYSTGVTIRPNTAEMAAIKEAWDGHYYNLLHVYTHSTSGEVGRIGLYLAEGSRAWQPITANDPDGYLPDNPRLHDTRNVDANGLECTTIYLTAEQYDLIKQYGLVVASRTDGLAINKITMSRPCQYSPYDTGTDPVKVDNAVQKDLGFIVKLALKSGADQGSIRTSLAERLPVTEKYPDGATEAEKSAVDARNAAEAVRAQLPFASAQFRTGADVELTAIGKPGYKLKEWKLSVNNGEATVIANPYTIQHHEYVQKTYSIVAEFEQALDPRLAFNSERTQKEIELALDLKGGSYNLPVYSDNMNNDSKKLIGVDRLNTTVATTSSSVNGTTNHVLTITPKGVGETSFIIYQPDGDYNGQGYGVSEEIAVNLKVVDVSLATKDLSSTAGFHRWSGYNATSYITLKNVGYANSRDDNGTTIKSAYGDVWSYGLNYADLSATDLLVLNATAGSDPTFTFNRDDAYGTPYQIKHNESNKYLTVLSNSNGTKSYVIDLAGLRKEKHFVHLNSITYTTGTINSIKIDQYACDAEDVYDAMVEIKNSPSNKDFTENYFYAWDKTAYDAKVTGEGTRCNYFDQFVTTAEGGIHKTILGNEWNNPLQYADLNNTDYLIIGVDKLSSSNGGKVPHLWFNKGASNDAEKLDFELNSESPYCYQLYTDADVSTYVVNLKKIRSAKGYSILNAITSGNGAGTKTWVSSVKIDKYSSAAASAYEDKNATKYKVGMHLRYTNAAGTANQDGKNIGKGTMTTEGIFYKDNGDGTYSAMAEKTLTVESGEIYYVVAGTTVTMTVPENPDFKFINWGSSGVTTLSRTLENINSNSTPYPQYQEKQDANLSLNVSSLSLNYEHTAENVTITSNNPTQPTYSGYDMRDWNEVNIWWSSAWNTSSKTGAIHVRAQKDNLNNKEITIHQAATDEYKSASVTLKVNVSDYYIKDFGIYAFRVPVNNKTVSGSAISDALIDYSGKVKVQVSRGTGMNDNSYITVKSNDDAWSLPILSTNRTWMSETAEHGLKEEGGYNFWFILSADTWNNHVKNGSLVFDSDLDITAVYVSKVD